MDWSTSFVPQVGAAYWAALQRGDLVEAAGITTEIERPLFDLAAELDPICRWAMLWHAALEVKGVAQRYLRPPHPTASEEEKERVAEALGTIGMA